MLEYIIDLKKKKLKKQSCQLLNCLKRPKYLQIVMANTERLNIKDTFEK